VPKVLTKDGINHRITMPATIKTLRYQPEKVNPALGLLALLPLLLWAVLPG
jgi:hypothetical protein